MIQDKNVIIEDRQGEVLEGNSSSKSSDAKKLYIESYGCQMNFSDSEVVASILKEKGYSTGIFGIATSSSWIFTKKKTTRLLLYNSVLFLQHDLINKLLLHSSSKKITLNLRQFVKVLFSVLPPAVPNSRKHPIYCHSFSKVFWE